MICLAALSVAQQQAELWAGMQGLNIAPALIAVAPTKIVVNPSGPLAISDTLVSAELPALPDLPGMPSGRRLLRGHGHLARRFIL